MPITHLPPVDITRIERSASAASGSVPDHVSVLRHQIRADSVSFTPRLARRAPYRDAYRLNSTLSAEPLR
jgi:hypothetical protein